MMRYFNFGGLSLSSRRNELKFRFLRQTSILCDSIFLSTYIKCVESNRPNRRQNIDCYLGCRQDTNGDTHTQTHTGIIVLGVSEALNSRKGLSVAWVNEGGLTEQVLRFNVCNEPIFLPHSKSCCIFCSLQTNTVELLLMRQINFLYRRDRLVKKLFNCTNISSLANIIIIIH